MKTETETDTLAASLQAFCRALCEAFENLPPEASKKVWEAFSNLVNEGVELSKEDLRDIYEALVTGLTLSESPVMKTETVTLERGETVTLTETETEFVIEAQDWGIEGAFGARLEIGTAFASRESALKAFEAVCKVIETEGEAEGEAEGETEKTFEFEGVFVTETPEGYRFEIPDIEDYSVPFELRLFGDYSEDFLKEIAEAFEALIIKSGL